MIFFCDQLKKKRYDNELYVIYHECLNYIRGSAHVNFKVVEGILLRMLLKKKVFFLFIYLF